MLDTEPKYIIINEETPDCEWEHWKDGVPCSLPGVMAIVDTKHDFHEGHFCDVHIGLAWKAVTGSDEVRILSLKPNRTPARKFGPN